MRRLEAILLNVATVVSLVVCVAGAALVAQPNGWSWKRGQSHTMLVSFGVSGDLSGVSIARVEEVPREQSWDIRYRTGWWGSYTSGWMGIQVQALYLHWRAVVPIWVAGATFVVWRLVRWRRGRRPRDVSYCVCGYDLRATPERCPECGRRAEGDGGGASPAGGGERQTIGPEARRLRAATAARLALAGWRPGRDVWGRLELPASFEIFPEAERVLRRFAGLAFGDRNDYARLDPCAGEEEVDQIRQCERKVGQRMYPVGFAEHQDREYYLIDEAGVVYVMYPGDALRPLASSFERALDWITRRSILRREQDEDLRRVGLAGRAWVLEEPPAYAAGRHGAVDAERAAEEEEMDHENTAGGNSPLDKRLLEGAWVGDVEEVREVLRLGADVECFNDTGHTPLHLAVENDWVEVARVLLQAGADVNRRTAGGDWTPLYRAVNCACDAASQLNRAPDNTMTRLLVGRGADVNARTSRGETPLQLARRYGNNEEAERILIRAGAEPQTG